MPIRCVIVVALLLKSPTVVWLLLSSSVNVPGVDNAALLMRCAVLINLQYAINAEDVICAEPVMSKLLCSERCCCWY